MKRNIISIDEQKCNGCGLCIPNCPEGAIQIIDNKARLVSDLMCDGLGACLGHCPQGAITVIEREAESYDERKVMVNIVKQGPGTIKAHLLHLKEHGQTEYLEEAVKFYRKTASGYLNWKMTLHQSISQDVQGQKASLSKSKTYRNRGPSRLRVKSLAHTDASNLPLSPHYKDSDMVLAADCVAFSFETFTENCLRERLLVSVVPSWMRTRKFIWRNSRL